MNLSGLSGFADYLFWAGALVLPFGVGASAGAGVSVWGFCGVGVSVGAVHDILGFYDL